MANGLCFVITGPSGSGKTTVVEKLLERLPSAARLVTTTTRAPREGEQDGVDYHFLSREEFIDRRERGEFLEWAETYGNLYGSSKIELEKLRASRDVVFAIVDTKGATAYREFVPDAVLVMLVAPIEQLKARLLRRKQVSDAELARRMAEAEAEMAFAPRCHHTVECFDGKLCLAADKIASFIAERRS
jgi:guanylate kinase